MLKPQAISSHVILSDGCFNNIYGKEILKNKDKVFQNTTNLKAVSIILQTFLHDSW